MRHLKRLFTSALMALILTVSVNAMVYHQADYYDIVYDPSIITPRMTTSPNSITYYVSSSWYFSSIASLCDAGVKALNSILYGIDLTRTYTYSSSLYDLSGYTYNTAENTYYAGVDAYTAVYCGTGPYGTNSRYLEESQIPCDYVLAESYFNIDKLSGVSPLNITWNQFVTSVITHETGHMLGLGHPTYNSVMQQYGYNSYRPLIPSSNEFISLDYLYSYRLNYII